MALKLPARKLIAPLRPAARPLQAPATRAPARTGPAPQTIGGGFGVAHALNEERERRANRPFEFSMKPGEGGMNGVTIILTDRPRLPAMPHFAYMHRWGFEENNVQTEVCITDGPEGCPLCRHLSKKGGYEMMLSCIDPRPYTPQRGPKAGQTTPRSKRPYPVKISMIPAFERLYQTHKTFRGMVIKLHRDNKKSPATGSQVEFVRMLDEPTLKKYGELSEPFDMAKVYPRLSPEKMGLIYNIDGSTSGTVGSEDFASGAGGVMNDDLPF
ncbi:MULTISPECIES: hypothetical protein [unclassified Bradyrhizobium]|uniref:hypothetical protein n=1 Tax=unclassified Bradyrhizobium TaxID=2631580 RepID=UPI0033958B74